MTDQPNGPEPVAVIGMALRVPGAVTPGQFWRNLVDGKDSLTRPTLAELRRAGVSRHHVADPNFVAAMPQLKDIDYFDASFFGIAAFEAEIMDPAHRMFLECAFEAMENGAVLPGADELVTGVFGGVEGAYFEKNLGHLGEVAPDHQIRPHNFGRTLPVRLGSALDFFTTRVSHKLDLTGPSFAVMAACATSLVAVHVAVQALRRGECDMALVGGATIQLPWVNGYMTSVEGMLSGTGRVRPFDADADGTIFGSGVGVMVLRPLKDAIADGNPIHAVIRGSASTNDGNPDSKESFIAPSLEGQIAATAGALADAGVSARSIGYLEAHGTATLLGDPVEATSASEVFRRDSRDTGYCAIGSVKANVGHLRAAAGIVSVIKACLTLKNATLPPLTNFTKHNPSIDFASSPFYLNTEALDWAQGPEPRRAGVSSFGFGGSNVHVVLEEHQAPPVPASSRREHLYVLSARSETALAQRMSDLAVCLEANPDFHAADVAHTLQNGRQEMEYRSFVTVDEDTFKPQDLNHRAPQSGAVVSPQARPLVFLFPGQGAQRPGMGQEIYAREEVYRQTVDHCAEILEPELGFDIRTLIHTESGAEDSAEILRQTANAQPALFVVEYALAKLFQSWGVTPTAMLGHSIGEVVAACLAGVFSLKDALKLVALRAKLMQQCEPGAMTAVFLGEKELSDRLPDGTEIAALNAPGLSVVSGPSDDISAFISKMNEAGIGTRPLQTSHAFHSWMMEPALPKFRTLLKSIELHPPEMPVISNATGLELTDKQALDPDYWSDHLRHTVRFSAGMAHLLAGTEPVFLELGPGHSLSDLARQHNPELDTIAALDSTNPRPSDNQSHTALGALGAIWCAGAPVRWRDYYGDESRRGVRLPTYPFERRRYWLEEGDFETTPVEPLNMYRPGWRMAEPETETPENDQRPWLIFRDQCGLGLAISERLKEAGHDVISVLPGEAFDEVEPGTFTVRPGSREDLREALGKACVLNGGQTPRVLHLWSVTGPEGPHNTLEAFEGSVLTGYHTLLALIQAAYDKGICDELDVTVIADGLRQMDGEDVPTYGEKGSLFGTVRSAPQELPGLGMRCVDISGCVGETTPGWLTDAAIAEALSEDRELLVLLRSTGRFVEELYPLTDLPLGKLRLRDQGTVLITGGVGGLGLKVAGTLFDAAAARLVLTSRWQPPPREDWPQRALEDDRIGRALKGILALEARGAEIMIVTTDIGDRDSLKSAVTQAESRFGRINGVVHAAAVGNDLPAINETRENAERVFPAKVHGAFNLEEIFADAPLDFFVYFSSQVTYFPDVGQSLYTACNGVLDALARRRAHKTGGLSCAIGWGAWEEIGLGAEHAGSRPRSAEETSTIDAGAAVTGTVDHPLIQTRHDSDEGEVFYRGILRKGDNWVFDHAFKGRTLLPGVAIFDGIHTTYSDHAATAPWAADDCAEYSQIVFLRPLFIDDEGTEIEIRFIAENERERVEVRSKPADQQAPWILTTTAFAKMNQVPRSEKAISVPDDLTEETIPRTLVTSISFNRRWDCILGNRAEGDETWGRLRLPEEFESDMGTYSSHPALLDRSLITCTDRFFTDAVPYTVDMWRVYAPVGIEYFIHGSRLSDATNDKFDVQFFEPDGSISMEVEGYRKREVEGSTIEGAAGGSHKLDIPNTGLVDDTRIIVSQPGDLGSVTTEEFAPRPPGPGEVQIKVIAAGLNFRDVLGALDQMPDLEGQAPPMGSECSGIVKAVGEGVNDLHPGEPVVALVPNSFADTVTVNCQAVAPVPANITMEDAAGLPTVFLTAEYAINQLARIQKGERILIHAAAGGVGLAAVQIARNAGAEIFATAGNPDKREYLHGLGIEHVMDSRSLDFVDGIAERTDGEGVDVVLNSLAGEFIPASLGVLRYRGRFLEIGKRDIYADTKMGLYPFRNNLSYYGIDLGQLIHGADPLLPRMFNSVMARFRRGDLIPPPTTVIPVNEVVRGFRQMSRAEHIGKIVFKIGQDPDPWREAFKRFEDHFIHGVPVESGLEALRRLLSSGTTPPYVLAMGHPIENIGQGEHTLSGGERARPDLETPYRAPTTVQEERLVRIWESTLGVAPVGVDDDFFELGGDSVTAIQIQFSVGKEYDTDLPTTVLFDYPNICGLAQFIDDAA